MRVGFIGLGNVGGKLAGSLVRNGFSVLVHDLDEEALVRLEAQGAARAAGPAEMTAAVDAVITCLPSPAASDQVVSGAGGVLEAMGPGKLWLEMSTTDAEEVRRLGARVAAAGGAALDCPVSGGCHRAATGNISIFAGGERAAFERALPLLSAIGRRILHTGGLGSASILKVITNYLATANLVSCAEALVTAKAAGMNLATAYEAIRISSGTSFVHETESQVILNGSRDINFTLGLVAKDVGLFQGLAERHDVPLDLSPLLLSLIEDGVARYGADEHSPNIIRRWEEATGLDIRAPGFPAEMTDDEPEVPGAEVTATR
ncbi:MAG: NAD(P)-dependent oxidoreductase [Pseudomonadota bacterium]